MDPTIPPEISAIQKFACPACGAEARWDPGKQALVCPYCSTVSPGEISGDGRTVCENDLAAALRQFSADKRDWQAVRTSVRCQSCQAISLFDPQRVGQRCDFCGSPALIAVTDTAAPIKPESLLPFKIDEGRVRDIVRQWYRTRWFAPNKLKTRALTDLVNGVYVPYWTFDAQVSAHWTAESGYYYYETETYRDSKGHTQTRQVRKVRWVPSSGQLAHFFDDELVPGSKGVQESLLRGIEPFPTRELLAYDPSYLSGWVVEQYQLDLIAAARRSREIMDLKVRGLCGQQVPGDTHRHLQVQANYSAQTFKHILVPVWLLSYTYGARVFQVLVNGYTGTVAGHYPKSWVKITLLVLALVLIALGIYAFAEH
jgi:hypothetical protein